MKLNFYKYHGTGNDFILIDNRENQLIPGPDAVAKLCNRRFGIGADGLILLQDADGYDFRMRYFNSDGNESTMCGNGGRCLVAFADFLSLIGKSCRFTGIDGEHTGEILKKRNSLYEVRLGMQDVTDFRISGQDFILDTGSPHFVRFVDELSNIDVITEGRMIRYMDAYAPGGINVNFVKPQGDKIFVRTYERGVEDETLSCGTGVTASALAFAFRKKTHRGTIEVQTKGGQLAVHFERKGDIFSHIFLEGPAVRVFQGNIETDDHLFIPENTESLAGK